MGKRCALTKVLAVVGAILAWFPLLAPLLVSAIALVAGGVFRFDYLMPADALGVLLMGIGGALLLRDVSGRKGRGA